jgi:hypothetical protein
MYGWRAASGRQAVIAWIRVVVLGLRGRNEQVKPSGWKDGDVGARSGSSSSGAATAREARAVAIATRVGEWRFRSQRWRGPG